MSEKSQTYEIIPGKKVKLPEKTKIKHLLKLRDLGFDLKDSTKINQSRLTMLQEPDVLVGVYNCIFDENVTLENLLDSDGVQIREALDDFLAQKCGVFFTETKK